VVGIPGEVGPDGSKGERVSIYHSLFFIYILEVRVAYVSFWFPICARTASRNGLPENPAYKNVCFTVLLRESMDLST
jgi:hypothetical protein